MTMAWRERCGTFAQQRTSGGRLLRLSSRGQLLGLLCFAALAACLAVTVAADDEVIASQPRAVFKNEEFLSRKKYPDVQAILQKPLTDRKFENLNQFLVALRDEMTEAGYQPSPDTPFTIVVPKVEPATVSKERLKDFFLEHLVPGVAFQTFSEDDLFGNENLHKMEFGRQQQKDGQTLWWTINGVKILRMEILNEKLSVIFIDGVLGDKKGTFAKRNIQETNRLNEPQRLVDVKNSTKHEAPVVKESSSSSSFTPSAAEVSSGSKSGNLMGFLANMKSGTKVFQHFLAKSNLSHVLDVPGGTYTVLIPSDNAFQRWHPIDWGFYPFSVHEFTENVLRNHFVQVKAPIRMDDLRKMDVEQTFKTLGGETVSFKSFPSPTVNNVTILSDFTLPNGNEVFLISEVLFVSESVVSKLHQLNRDKETPPLLAFPWFGAQFLSHSFLALERDNRFSQITRFLNAAEIAPYVSGSNLTFFVPTDAAFERLGLHLMPDEILGSEIGVKMLLNHFVKGRLYDRDLADGTVFEAVGGALIRIHRQGSNVTVNGANVIESEVFVYNLGTMFYIDDVLYSNYLLGPPATTEDTQATATTTTVRSNTAPPGDRRTTTVTVGVGSTAAEAELLPKDMTVAPPTEDEFLLDDDEIITPRALPVVVVGGKQK